MTRRLIVHWVALHTDLGLNPHDAGSWTLDEAIGAEVYAEDAARARRVAAVAAKAQGRRR